MLQLAQLERMRDVVTEYSGKLVIKFFVPGDRDYYLISYATGEAEYGRVTACGGEQRETFEKIWPSRILDVVHSSGVCARLKLDDGPPEWFDSAEDSRALDKLYHSVMSLK